MSDLHVETQLAPTLQPGDMIILDNLAAHHSPTAAAAMKRAGAWFVVGESRPLDAFLSLKLLPACSPDLNPIEMAFAKLKALIRRAAARTSEAFWRAAGQVSDLFTDEECYNFFKAAGYETN